MPIAQKMLEESARRLSEGGATILCIGSNTVHLLLDDLKKQTMVPFLSMPELVSKKCHDLGYKKVGLVGTPMTLDSGLYPNALKDIEVITPESSQFPIVEKVIRNVLAGNEIGEDTEKYIEVLNSLQAQGAESIILGCTELPLVLDYEKAGYKVTNSVAVLAEALTDHYYA